jgi:cell division septal protein FtsQ
LLFFAIVITAGYFLLFFSKIQIKNIIIYGNNEVPAVEISGLVDSSINKRFVDIFGFNLSSKSIFLADAQKIKSKILQAYPEIKGADIVKMLPDSLAVEIKERDRSAIFSQNEKYFYIDQTGVIFDEIQEVKAGFFIVRQNLDNNEIYEGKKVIHDIVMEAIIKIAKNLKDNFDIDLSEALISTPTKLNITTKENWKIYFNIEEGSDISLQIAKLNLLLEQEISLENRHSLEYINLYFKNRAFYK